MGRRGATLSLRTDFGKRDSCDSTSSERLVQITSYYCCQVLCTDSSSSSRCTSSSTSSLGVWTHSC